MHTVCIHRDELVNTHDFLYIIILKYVIPFRLAHAAAPLLAPLRIPFA